MSNQIELRHLRYFLAVAEELHFRKAADKLYISQPGLSRQIKQMEEELGFLLFERTNKKVKLTAAGEYLKKEATLMLKNLEDILQYSRQLSEGLEGNIQIAYVGSAMQNVIPQLLLQCRADHPSIRFSLKEMDNTLQVEALLKKNIDMGFVRLNQVPGDLKLKPVLIDTFSLVLPKDHPIDQNNFKSIKQLQDESFILFEKTYSSAYYERVMSIFESAGFSPSISHYTVHANTIFRLVENRFGISIIPTSLKEGYALNVKFVELTKIAQRAILSVCWNSKNRNPLLKKILHYL
ncbi:MAG: LysR family transcriptional regulator [Bacteroidota bacterium]